MLSRLLINIAFLLCAIHSFVLAVPVEEGHHLEARYKQNYEANRKKLDEELKITIFPKKIPKDAPFSVKKENDLRNAIQVPDGFGTGSTPVILVPGTGFSGEATYSTTLGKLLEGTDYSDPVWLNIPGNSLLDAQVTSEFVAYAINYISAVSRKKVVVISFSQGGPNTQWALKYWPSTREVVSNFIALSADFKGTKVGNEICKDNNLFSVAKGLCPASVIQQMAESNYIKRLQADGGGSAYVPTTTIYSNADKVVQPQKGKGASGYMPADGEIATVNIEIQTICPKAELSHKQVVSNGVTWTLIKRILQRGQPPTECDLTKVKIDKPLCGKVAEGLTEEGVKAVLDQKPPKMDILLRARLAKDEPSIKRYARDNTPRPGFYDAGSN